MTVRTHVILPESLVASMDKLVGKRRRSRYIEEAIREKLIRDAQSEALKAAAGALASEDYPEWSTPEATSAWVSALRRTEAELRPTPDVDTDDDVRS
jgi:hypothetical protein